MKRVSFWGVRRTSIYLIFRRRGLLERSLGATRSRYDDIPLFFHYTFKVKDLSVPLYLGERALADELAA